MKKSIVLGGVGLAVLTGCGYLDSRSESDVQSISPWEDCVSFNYMNTAIKQFGPADFRLVDGTHLLFQFPNLSEAQQGLQIIRTYKMGFSCFVGRPGPSMSYQLSAPGALAPTGASLMGEDCIAFNPNTTAVRYFANLRTFKLVDGNMWLLDFGLNQAEAYRSLQVVRKYLFNRQCFVGRPGPSFEYWKRM